MLNTNDAAIVMDTILSSPGMNEMVKIDFKISRKNVLLLTSVIERGLSAKDEDKSNIIDIVQKESLQELTSFSADCLQKAGLTEMSEKLKALSGKSNSLKA
jgi:hypothetical protein